MLLKRSSFVTPPPPQSHLFSYEQHLQRSRGVQFCHRSLSSLCVFVLKCVSVCGPLQSCRETEYTIASWLYKSCCGIILTAEEACFVCRGLLWVKRFESKGLSSMQREPHVTSYHQKTWTGNNWTRMRGACSWSLNYGSYSEPFDLQDVPSDSTLGWRRQSKAALREK